MSEAADCKGAPSSAVAAVSANPSEADRLPTFALDLSVRIVSASPKPTASPPSPSTSASPLPRPPSPSTGFRFLRPFRWIWPGRRSLRRVTRLASTVRRGLHLVLNQNPVGTDATHLPCDILLNIARRVVPPRRNVMAMRSTCRAWRAGVPNTNGPLLMASHLDAGKMVALQLTAPEGGNPSLVPCACICQPPFSAALWGAANGLLALHKIGTDYLFLYCLNCGDMVPLPRLPPGCSTGCASDDLGAETFGSGGVFFNELPTKKLFANLCWEQYPNFVTHRKERKAWSLYPETKNIHMMSVAFPNETQFIGISDSVVVVGPVLVLYPDRRNPFSTSKAAGEVFFIDIPAEGDPGMQVWGSFGNHVFRCADRVYACVMSRSVDDANIVSAAVYTVDQLPDGAFTLVRTYNIGPFAVYLGANQPLVLPASGSANQAANTIYIKDDDGLNNFARVCAVNIASGDTLSIPLPPPMSGLLYARPVWVAPPPLNVPFWHCDTKMGF